MPGILITRPRPAAETFAERLRALGYTPFCEPLLTIRPTHAPAPAADFDACIVTSANAVTALRMTAQRNPVLLRLPCYCVGPSTADAARNFGFQAVRSDETPGGGSDLARFILAANGSPRAFLHIAGQHTDPALHTSLTAAGHSVATWPVYTAQPVAALTPATVAALQGGGIAAVLVFSARTAAQLAGHLTAQGLKACCASLTAIGLSEAVTVPLRPLGWRSLQAAPRPTEDAVLAALQACVPVISAAG